MHPEETLIDSFTEFVKGIEPQLKHALVAALGTDLGLEATAEGLAYGWEQWERIRKMDNPGGYLYRVGKSRVKGARRGAPVLPRVSSDPQPWVEPGLPDALSRLSERQRVAVLLIHTLGYTFSEVADLLGVSKTTVQKHVERGLKRLRAALGGET